MARVIEDIGDSIHFKRQQALSTIQTTQRILRILGSFAFTLSRLHKHYTTHLHTYVLGSTRIVQKRAGSGGNSSFP